MSIVQTNVVENTSRTIYVPTIKIILLYVFNKSDQIKILLKRDKY